MRRDLKEMGGTSLQEAAESGASGGTGGIIVVRWLLKEGVKVNAPASDEGGRTAPEAAAGHGYMIMVECLLEGGAEVNKPGSYDEGRTALQAAAESGHINKVERLLRGAPGSMRLNPLGKGGQRSSGSREWAYEHCGTAPGEGHRGQCAGIR